MKKFMLMFAAVAGVSIFAMSGTAEASHRCYGGSGYSGGYYSRGFAPTYYGGGGYYSGYRGRSYHRGGYYDGYHGHHHHGYYGGRRGGYYGSGFGIQTRGFGLYIR